VYRPGTGNSGAAGDISSSGVKFKQRNTIGGQSENYYIQTPEGHIVESGLDSEDTGDGSGIWLDSLLGTSNYTTDAFLNFWGIKFWKVVVHNGNEFEEVIFMMARGKTYSSQTTDSVYNAHYWNIANPFNSNSASYNRKHVGTEYGHNIQMYESYASYMSSAGNKAMILKASSGYMTALFPRMVAMYYLPFSESLHYSTIVG
jgi:hypothetical protein